MVGFDRSAPMRAKTERFPLAKVLVANPSMLRVNPAASLFMAKYMRNFPLGGSEKLILHSHLPPLTSKAYSRFVSHHLIERGRGRRTPRSA